ncbi:MAG: hypothetical protein WC971_06965 [Coriobacteriia bacterium]
MPYESLQDRVSRWSEGQDQQGPTAHSTLEQVRFLADYRFCEYLPAVGPPAPPFTTRLRHWLDCVDDDRQRLLLALVPELMFASFRDFVSLYRAAFRGPVSRWLLEQCEPFSLDDEDLAERIEAASRLSWYCPVTDSMDIASFYHANNIEGARFRPDWYSLRGLGDLAKIENHMDSCGFRFLILLEDFVGSGSQMNSAVTCALALPDRFKVLLVPLLVCPDGHQRGLELQAAHPGRLTFSPVFVLRGGATVLLPASGTQGDLFPRIRQIAADLYTTMTGQHAPDPCVKPYGPDGFEGTGSLLVMYSNTPDNSLPLLHYSSDTWKPLFPRSSRV